MTGFFSFLYGIFCLFCAIHAIAREPHEWTTQLFCATLGGYGILMIVRAAILEMKVAQTAPNPERM